MENEAVRTEQDNPYLPPQAELTTAQSASSEAAPAFKLYKSSGILLATFLGSLLAGGIVMSINFKRMGRSNLIVPTIGFSALGMAVVMVLSYVLPENFPSMVFLIPQLWAMKHFTQQLQGEAVQAHIQNGGLMESNWMAVALSIPVIVVLLALLALVLF